MNKPIQDGGRAFPRPTAEGYPGQQGMTLRDYFAGQALTGLIAADPDCVIGYKDYAIGSYLVADAMLAARGVLP